MREELADKKREDLAYKRGADLLSHALRSFEQVSHEITSLSLSSADLPKSLLGALVRAVVRTFDRKVLGVLRGRDGDIRAQVEVGECDAASHFELEQEVQALRVEPRAWMVREIGQGNQGRLGDSAVLACGFRSSPVGRLGGELWLIVFGCDRGDQYLLKHEQTWLLLLALLEQFKTLLDVKLYLQASRGLFDDDNREVFLSRSVESDLRSLSLGYLPPELYPAAEDALQTVVQAILLVDGDSFLASGQFGADTSRKEAYDEWVRLVAPTKREKLSSSHRSLIEVLEAAGGASLAGIPKSRPEDKGDKILWMSWLTSMLYRLSRPENSSSLSGPVNEWSKGLGAMCSVTARFLADWSVQRGQPGRINLGSWFPEPFGASYVSPWLRLWLCHELLRHELKAKEALPGVSNARKRRYRLALVYVLRETIRFFLFGRRADYRFRPRILTLALRRLVVHHAEHVVGVDDSLDLTELLSRIERSGEAAGRELSAGHVQHVFEVYITGQFLGSLSDSGGPLWDRLAEAISGASPASLLSPLLRRAFAVASLLHDFGSLLFPAGGPGLASFRDLVRETEPALDKLKGALRSAADGVATSALDSLREWSDLFDQGEWDAITRWQKERLASLEKPEPALLAAWYVNGLMLQHRLNPELRRHVVRAIVLDRVTTLEVRADRDPVAALLMICDALFAWDPRPARHDEALIGRTFSSLQGAGRQVVARYDSLGIPGLVFKVTEEDGKPAVFSAELPEDRPFLLPSFHISSGLSFRGDAESVLNLWLDLSIALGRVRDAGLSQHPAGLGAQAPKGTKEGKAREPWIEVESVCEGPLIGKGVRIEDLVGEAAQRSSAPLRRALESWLARLEEASEEHIARNQSPQAAAFDEASTSPRESASTKDDKNKQRFQFNPTGAQFSDRDPAKMLEELSGTINTVILQRLAKNGSDQDERA